MFMYINTVSKNVMLQFYLLHDFMTSVLKSNVNLYNLILSPPFPKWKILDACQNVSILIYFPTQFLCYIVAPVKDCVFWDVSLWKYSKCREMFIIRQRKIEESLNL